MRHSICIVVSEASSLVWLRRHLAGLHGLNPYILTFGSAALPHAHQVLGFSSSPDVIVRHIQHLAPDLVFFFTNQASLLRDAEIGKALQDSGIRALYQPLSVARLGFDKIQMKDALSAASIAVTPGICCSSIDESLSHFVEGKRYVLKRPSLSDARMLRVVDSRKEIESYYYDFDVTGQVLMEEYVAGLEYSCAAITLGSKVHILPPVFKGKTEYLVRFGRSTGRFYLLDLKLAADLAHKLKELALSVADAIGSQWLIGLDMVVVDDRPMIIEVNTRLVETMRMSLLSVRRNIFEEGIRFALSGPKSSPYTGQLHVVDMPIELVGQGIDEDECVCFGAARVSIAYRDEVEIDKIISTSSNSTAIRTKLDKLAYHHEQ